MCVAVVNGLRASNLFSEIELEVLRLSTGPQLCTWVFDKDIPGIKETRVQALTSRGVLMGIPTSWSILNLVHLFWWSEAKKVVSNSAAKVAFSCFGDDGLVVAPLTVIKEYNRLIVATGGELSEGKHALSKTRGVYLEHILNFDCKFVWQNSDFPVRSKRHP